MHIVLLAERHQAHGTATSMPFHATNTSNHRR
ncbi:unnamed protein product, partial [Allacma fusca]